MRHVKLTCRNHPELRWSCKSIAYTPGKGYNGARNIFFEGKLLNEEQQNLIEPEYTCPPTELTIAPEDPWALLSIDEQRKAIAVAARTGRPLSGTVEHGGAGLIAGPAPITAPPSIALAMMAMCLAEQRTIAAGNYWPKGYWTFWKIRPRDRDQVSPTIHPLSTEYYKIIDRLSAGETP